MPDTLTLEEATKPDTMTLEEAQAEPTSKLPEGWKPKPDATSMMMGPDGLKRESGMEHGTGLTSSVGTSVANAIGLLPPQLRSLPKDAQDTISESDEPWFTKLQQAMPKLFGPPGEQPEGAEVKGAIPAVYRILYGKNTEPGERPEPGLLRFSPKDLFPEQNGYGLEYARQASGMVNIENLTLLKGLGVLAKSEGPIADWAKAGIAAYFSKQGAEMGGQAAGERFSGAHLTAQDAAQKDWEMLMGGVMALGPGVEVARENAAVKPFKEPPVSGSMLRPPVPRVEPSEATKQAAMLEVGRSVVDDPLKIETCNNLLGLFAKGE